MTHPFLGAVPGRVFICDEVQRYKSLVPHVRNLHEYKKTKQKKHCNFHFINYNFLDSHGNEFKMLVFQPLNI